MHSNSQYFIKRIELIFMCLQCLEYLGVGSSRMTIALSGVLLFYFTVLSSL